MDDRAGNIGAADGHRKAPECALVDESQLTAAVVEGQAYPQVRLVGSIGWLDEQLTTHAEMSEDRVPLSSGATGACHAGALPRPAARRAVPRSRLLRQRDGGWRAGE